MSELDKLRKKIDGIDDGILALLEQRAAAARRVGEIKKEMSSASSPLVYYVPEREQQILDRLEGLKSENFPKGAIQAVFREVISACRSLQSPMKIAFLGPRGTFSHAAAQKTFGLAVEYLDCSTLDAVFDSVQRGEAEFGVVPIENSTEGGVVETMDLLIGSPLKIHHQTVLEIAHCLVGSSGQLSEVERVYSHGQALSQCSKWLAKNLPGAQKVLTTSTMEAVQKAKTEGKSVAIASRTAAEEAHLTVLREDIQDQKQNATRFYIVHRSQAPKTKNDQTALIFSIKDGAGALVEVLNLFRTAQVNLTRIESRASRDRVWEYFFFVELEGHQDDPNVAEVLAKLPTFCLTIKILGSFPRGG